MTLDELNAQALVVPFVEMEPHLKRGAVILVDPTLDLAEVGLMLAQDDRPAVESLLQQQLLEKASMRDFEAWRRDKRFFRILIVQPFVLAQDFVALSPQDN